VSLLSFLCDLVTVMIAQVVVFSLARRGGPMAGGGGSVSIGTSRATCNSLFGLSLFASILIGFAALWSGAGDRTPRLEDLSILLAVCLACGSLSVWDAFRSGLVVGEEGIERHSSWLGRDFMAWNEVDRLTFDRARVEFVIRAADGRRFHVAATLAGVGLLLDRCERRLPSSAMMGAEPGYAAIRRKFPYVRVGCADGRIPRQGRARPASLDLPGTSA
jgi:hypothetical protein